MLPTVLEPARQESPSTPGIDPSGVALASFNLPGRGGQGHRLSGSRAPYLGYVQSQSAAI
jgi:hypothetical protein